MDELHSFLLFRRNSRDNETALCYPIPSMNDQPESNPGPVKPAQTVAGSATPQPTDSSCLPPEVSTAPAKPTPEEQMAAFEKALKEEDWGHQPC